MTHNPCHVKEGADIIVLEGQALTPPLGNLITAIRRSQVTENDFSSIITFNILRNMALRSYEGPPSSTIISSLKGFFPPSVVGNR